MISHVWHTNHPPHVTLASTQWYALSYGCHHRHIHGYTIWSRVTLGNAKARTREETLVEENFLKK